MVEWLESVDDGQDVVRVQDLVFLAVELDFGAAVFGVEHAVALFDFEGDFLAVVIGLAGADGDDDAFLRLFLGGIRDDDAAFLDFFFLGGFDQDAVAEGFEVGASHNAFLFSVWFVSVSVSVRINSRRTARREKCLSVRTVSPGWPEPGRRAAVEIPAPARRAPN